MNEKGAVVGMNTWVNMEAKRYYALSAWYVKQLLDAAATAARAAGEIRPAASAAAGRQRRQRRHLAGAVALDQLVASGWKLPAAADYWKLTDLVAAGQCGTSRNPLKARSWRR